jgi:hypothetical protein
MPCGSYKSFDECVSKNKDKKDPEAYCAEIKRKTEKTVDWNYQFPITKIVGVDEEVLYIAGEASNPEKDDDDEIMDMESLKGAYARYMSNPVVKFMHDRAPQWMGSIGRVVPKHIDKDGVEYVTSFDKKPFLVVQIKKNVIPGWMWNAIKEGDYKGFSIGGKALKKVAGRIYVKSWIETSVVDTPSAHGAFFTVLKRACIGDECPYELETSKEVDDFIKVLDSYRISVFLDASDEFLKGGTGSGVKGHRSNKPDFKNMTEQYAAMDIKEVKEKLLKHYAAGEIQEIESRHGEKALRARLQSIDTGKPVSFKKIEDAIDLFLKGGKGSGVKGHRTRKNDIQETKKAIKEATVWRDSLLVANSSYVYIANNVIDAFTDRLKKQGEQ